MRWLLLVCGVLALLLGCDRAESNNGAGPANTGAAADGSATESSTHTNGLPVILVDAEHAMKDEHSRSKPYLIDGARGIVLDASRYTLNDPGGLMRRPNAMQVLYGSSVYSAKWPDDRSQLGTLDSSTIRVLKGAPFNGFGEGMPAYVAIGFESMDDQSNQARFTPFWAAAVIFR
jgi:hypothetical protein